MSIQSQLFSYNFLKDTPSNPASEEKKTEINRRQANKRASDDLVNCRTAIFGPVNYRWGRVHGRQHVVCDQEYP